MSHFPVTNSNLSATHLAAFLQEKYKFNSPCICRLLRAGINDTYTVTCETEKFVFRIYSLNWRTRKEIEEELRLLQLLKEHNISVSYPLADTEKNYIQVLNAPEGERFGVLFSFAPGEKNHIFSKETHFKIGDMMAQMHSLTHNMSLQRVSYTPQVLLVDSLNKIREFLSSGTDEMNFMESAQSTILKELSTADLSKIRQGAVHVDIWCDNLNTTKEGAITLFDFDFCGNGWLCLDVAYYVLQLNNIERDEKECQLKTDAFLKGYESVTPLSEEEKRFLPMLGVSMYFFYLGIQCKRFDNWSNSFLSENYLQRFINGLVKRYYDLKGLGKIQ